MINLEYYNETTLPLSGALFEEILEFINIEFREIFPKEIDNRRNYLITCTLVNDKIIQEINKQQRGLDKPTDVISLCYLGNEFPGEDMIGEIFISLDTAAKQAKKLDHDLVTELKFLFVHGVLHILGYEHATEEDFQTMMDLTNQILGAT